MTLLLNGARTPVRDGWETWGDLVEGLDADLETTHQVLTSVRLDGVDEPSFRSGALLARPVESFSRIEIRTGEASLLARQSLAEAALALSELSDATRVVAQALRSADVSPAMRDMECLTQNLLTVFQVVAAASGPLADDFDGLEEHGCSLHDLTQVLDGHARELIAAQESGDWIRLSDALEFDLEPTLQQWRSALLRVAA